MNKLDEGRAGFPDFPGEIRNIIYDEVLIEILREALKKKLPREVRNRIYDEILNQILRDAFEGKDLSRLAFWRTVLEATKPFFETCAQVGRELASMMLQLLHPFVEYEIELSSPRVTPNYWGMGFTRCAARQSIAKEDIIRFSEIRDFADLLDPSVTKALFKPCLKLSTRPVKMDKDHARQLCLIVRALPELQSFTIRHVRFAHWQVGMMQKNIEGYLAYLTAAQWKCEVSDRTENVPDWETSL
ncbi:MAG: hypothetical protein M1820_008915 [Bogoriella megaspora]|nr:MAG: hypothetical protein M1820_008915 [Bogoriella megaspora]